MKVKKKNPIETVMQQLERTASKMKLDKNILEKIRYPKRILSVSVPIQMDNGKLKVFRGYRVQHNMDRGPCKGGIRFHPDVNIEEITALAMLMTRHTNIPAAILISPRSRTGSFWDSMKLRQRTRKEITRSRSSIRPNRRKTT